MVPGPPTARARLRALAVALTAAAALGALPAGASAQLAVEHVRATISEVEGDGDGVVGPGETFELTERIRHADSLTPSLTNVTGFVSEDEIQLIALQRASSYPDMAFGEEADNTPPYAWMVSSDADCGAAYDMSLRVGADQGEAQVPFRISTGGPGPLASYESADVPKPVTDLTPVESALTVTGAGRVKDLQVRVGDLTHTSAGDVTIELVAPSGASVVLVSARGDERDDFAGTVFSDAATQSIRSAAPPFTGTYRPQEPLANLAGEEAQGEWKLRVTDELGTDEGELNAWGLDVRTAVCDGKPVAFFEASPSPVLPGQTLTLDASGSSDPNGSIVSYEWDLDDDGQYDDATGVSPTTSFPVRGRHPVALRVTDDRGDTGTRTMQVSVTDPPVAALDASPASPLTGQDTVLDASGSSDPDGAPLERYEWDLDGDGAFERNGGPEPTITAQWGSPGTRTVGVRVTDEDGAGAVDTLDVVVRNRPPVPAFTHPAPVLAGSAMTFDAGGSTDPDSAISRYEWDFDGDGTYEVDGGTAPTAQHAFPAAGDVTVGLRVTDEHGAVETTTRSVSVTLAPVASFTATPNPVSLQRPVAFDASASSDADGTIARYEWDLDGDGSFETDTGAVPSATRSYSTGGTRSVRLRVTDDDGAQATATVALTAANVLPVAAVVVTPGTVDAGQPVTLDASGSSEPDGTIAKYDWDLDGNGSYEATSGAAPTRTHSYPNAGGFTVGVRVTDNHGGARTASAKLVVRAPAVPPTATTGATTGSSAPAATAPGAPGAAGDPVSADLRATLTGLPLQRVTGVLRRGLTVGCRADRAATCALRAELRAADARRLGLRTVRARPVVVGRVVMGLTAAGTRTARVRFTAKARRALRRVRRARRVAIVVRGTVSSAGEGGRSALVRTFLLRR